MAETVKKIEELLETLKKTGKKDDVLMIKTIYTLRKVLETNQPPKKSSSQVLSTMLKLLKFQDKGVRVEIALILGEIATKAPEKTKKCLNILNNLINDSFTLVRKSALLSLEKILFENKTLPPEIASKISKRIVRLATDKDRDIRKQAIKTVRKFKHIK